MVNGEVLSEINRLNDKINLIDDNLKFNIGLFISLLALFVAVTAGGLYFLTKSIVEKSMQSKVMRIKEELRRENEAIKKDLVDFKDGLNERIIDLIDNRSKIKWQLGQFSNDVNDQISIHGLSGEIDWESPITNFRVRDVVNKTEIPFEILEKRDNGFTFRTTDKTSAKYLEWIIVWYDKSE